MLIEMLIFSKIHFAAPLKLVKREKMWKNSGLLDLEFVKICDEQEKVLLNYTYFFLSIAKGIKTALLA